jgi:hypothetical protein
MVDPVEGSKVLGGGGVRESFDEGLTTKKEGGEMDKEAVSKLVEELEERYYPDRVFKIKLTQDDLDSLVDGDSEVFENVVEHITNQAKEAGWKYREVGETYKYKGKTKLRYPCRGTWPLVGDEVFTAGGRLNKARGIANVKVKILERYYTVNQGFRNYAAKVEILEGPKKGKVYRLNNQTFYGSKTRTYQGYGGLRLGGLTL